MNGSENQTVTLSKQTTITAGLGVVILVSALGVYTWAARNLEAASDRTGVKIEKLTTDTATRLEALRRELSDLKTQLAVVARTQRDVDALRSDLGGHKTGQHVACIARLAELEVRIAAMESRQKERGK